MSRISHIELDDSNLAPPTPEIEQERKVAIFDLLEENSFELPARDDRAVPDMARRGIHNEGARILSERLEGKAEIDHDTARRLFTLVCVLHFGS